MDITDYSNEEWRPVAGWEQSYEVSSHGRVAGVRQIGRWTGKRIRKLKLDRFGYHATGLYLRGKTRFVQVHVLVAEAFICPRPEGLIVNHKDSDRTNNHYSNLEWTTYQGNTLHAIAAGRWATGKRNGRYTKPESWANSVYKKRPYAQGEKAYNSKLTNAQAMEMKKIRYYTGKSYTEIGRMFGVRKGVAAFIIQGRSWKHIPPYDPTKDSNLCLIPAIPTEGKLHSISLDSVP
jgi:hypothetical protein